MRISFFWSRERASIAACCAAGVGLGSVDEESEELSWARRKRSAGSSAHRASTSDIEMLSTYGTVVVDVRRSGRVVKGLSAPRAWPLVALDLPPRELRKFCTSALVSWGADDDAL